MDIKSWIIVVLVAAVAALIAIAWTSRELSERDAKMGVLSYHLAQLQKVNGEAK